MVVDLGMPSMEKLMGLQVLLMLMQSSWMQEKELKPYRFNNSYDVRVTGIISLTNRR